MNLALLNIIKWTVLGYTLFWASQFCLARTFQETYFPGSEYELNIYRIYGAEDGTTMMIIGGIQGNEPGGYLAADLYVDMALQKGNLIVIPRANFKAIQSDRRSINHDMNRCFVRSPKNRGNYEDLVVEKLKAVMGEVDVLLNLHDGSGFYAEQWESENRNPLKWGQSIIADYEVYPHGRNDRPIYLGNIARKIVGEANSHIHNPDYRFHFNNTRTGDPDTPHPEQRTSATYYALTTYGIPAFGIETSKEITDLEYKVRLQTMVINSFMREFGIIPENPKIYLDPPQLKYLVVTVNNANALVVPNKGYVRVKRGDSIEISHVEANYERGLTADIIGVGKGNDFRERCHIYAPTVITVKKDKYECGRVRVILGSSQTRERTGTGLRYLLVEVNGERKFVPNGDHLEVVRGGIIRIVDAVTDFTDFMNLKVNFKGFVPQGKINVGDDRDYPINTATDLMPRYSTDKEGKHYRIVVQKNGEKVGEIWVDIIEPKLHYLVLKRNGGPGKCYADGKTMYAKFGDTVEIMDVKTNIPNNSWVKVNFRGYLSDREGEDRNQVIRLDGGLLSEYSLDGKGEKYEIWVTRHEKPFGRVWVKIAPMKKRGEMLTSKTRSSRQ